MQKNKKMFLVIIIAVVLLLVVGISFAAYNYNQTGTTSSLVLGDIYMHYEEANTLSLENAMPGDNYSKYFEFTISGKNTYTEKDIWYDVILTRGSLPEGKTEENRIPDEYLKFRLVEVVGDVETELFTDKTYSDLTSQRVYVNTIGKGVNSYNKTYRLYMVVSEELKIGNTSEAIFSIEDWNNAFASIKVSVTGDFEEKEIAGDLTASETIKEKIVSYSVASASDFSGGLVAINGTEGDDYGLLYNENNASHTIREYRYTGRDVDNYIYYNCLDTAGGYNYGDENYDYASNCEVFRIVGIFNENGEEFLKIMNNNTLTNIPTTYVYDGTTYTVGYNGTTAYWNYTDTLKSTNYNDWTTAGLQYYLNTEQDDSETPVAGYLSRLSTNAKNLIRETTYYLGNVVRGSDGDTTISAYANERNGDNISPDNEPTWNGKVALLYPSDYGYSVNPSYWSNTKLFDYDGETIKLRTWMMQTANHSATEWLISPSSNDSDSAVHWGTAGYLDNLNTHNSIGVREVLNLKSNTKVLKGDGDVSSPYVVIAE